MFGRQMLILHEMKRNAAGGVIIRRQNQLFSNIVTNSLSAEGWNTKSKPIVDDEHETCDDTSRQLGLTSVCN